MRGSGCGVQGARFRVRGSGCGVQGAPHLVHAVTEAAQLVHAPARLHVRVVARTDGAHAGGLVPSVRLRGVLEVRVRAWGVERGEAQSGGSGLRVDGLGPSVWSLEFGVRSLGYGAQGLGFRVLV